MVFGIPYLSLRPPITYTLPPMEKAVADVRASGMGAHECTAKGFSSVLLVWQAQSAHVSTSGSVMRSKYLILCDFFS